jgi:hypothetical protein
MMLCMIGTPLLKCGPSGCSVTEMRACTVSGCWQKKGKPFESQKGTTNAPTPFSGCCICKPGCCDFLLPDNFYELPFAAIGAFDRSAFADPRFSPQFVYPSIWHPPAQLA